MRAVHGHYINVLIRQIAAPWAQAAGRAGFWCGCVTRSAVDFLQPVQQLGFGLPVGQFRGLGYGSQARGFLLRGARRLGCFEGGYGTCMGLGAACQHTAHVGDSLVARLEHQRHAVFAVVAHRAVAITVPVGESAVSGQCNVNAQLVGRTLAALHLAGHDPMVTRWCDVHRQHFVAAVQRQTATPSTAVTLFL